MAADHLPYRLRDSYRRRSMTGRNHREQSDQTHGRQFAPIHELAFEQEYQISESLNQQAV